MNDTRKRITPKLHYFLQEVFGVERLKKTLDKELSISQKPKPMKTGTIENLTLRKLQSALEHCIYLQENTRLMPHGYPLPAGFPKKDAYLLIDEDDDVIIIPLKIKKYWDKSLNKRMKKIKKQIEKLTKTQKP